MPPACPWTRLQQLTSSSIMALISSIIDAALARPLFPGRFSSSVTASGISRSVDRLPCRLAAAAGAAAAHQRPPPRAAVGRARLLRRPAQAARRARRPPRARQPRQPISRLRRRRAHEPRAADRRAPTAEQRVARRGAAAGNPQLSTCMQQGASGASRRAPDKRISG